jgi:hypothetical protein
MSYRSRVAALEWLELERYACRLARQIGADPAELLRRAEEIAELRRHLGSAGALQVVAAGSGKSVTDFQARVEQIEADLRGARDDQPGATFEPARGKPG